MNTENRRAKRKQVSERIDVVDTMLEAPIGIIGNISESGMMLLTHEALHDDALYQFRFALYTDRTRHDISVGAHHLWSRPANMPGQHWTGFRFIDIAPEDQEALRAWIELPGNRYV